MVLEYRFIDYNAAVVAIGPSLIQYRVGNMGITNISPLNNLLLSAIPTDRWWFNIDQKMHIHIYTCIRIIYLCMYFIKCI